jgi:hypothetical protein
MAGSHITTDGSILELIMYFLPFEFEESIVKKNKKQYKKQINLRRARDSTAANLMGGLAEGANMGRGHGGSRTGKQRAGDMNTFIIITGSKRSIK